MNDKITVCLGKGGQREMAESFARKNNVPIMDKPGEHLTVMFDSRGVSLTGYGLTYQGDFEGMLHRVTNGRLSHEMLVRAVKTEGEHLKAIDATAGMGEDGFLLAAYGYEVRNFGHAGDGNLHIYCCANDMELDEFKRRSKAVMDKCYAKCTEFGGQVSGEHAIGHAKKQYLLESVGETAFGLMQAIKQVFDPKGILNPGKVCTNVEEG